MAPKRVRGKTTPVPAPTRTTRSRAKASLSAESDLDSTLGDASCMDTSLEGEDSVSATAAKPSIRRNVKVVGPPNPIVRLRRKVKTDADSDVKPHESDPNIANAHAGPSNGFFQTENSVELCTGERLDLNSASIENDFSNSTNHEDDTNIVSTSDETFVILPSSSFTPLMESDQVADQSCYGTVTDSEVNDMECDEPVVSLNEHCLDVGTDLFPNESQKIEHGEVNPEDEPVAEMRSQVQETQNDLQCPEGSAEVDFEPMEAERFSPLIPVNDAIGCPPLPIALIKQETSEIVETNPESSSSSAADSEIPVTFDPTLVSSDMNNVKQEMTTLNIKEEDHVSDFRKPTREDYNTVDMDVDSGDENDVIGHSITPKLPEEDPTQQPKPLQDDSSQHHVNPQDNSYEQLANQVLINTEDIVEEDTEATKMKKKQLALAAELARIQTEITNEHTHQWMLMHDPAYRLWYEQQQYMYSQYAYPQPPPPPIQPLQMLPVKIIEPEDDVPNGKPTGSCGSEPPLHVMIQSEKKNRLRMGPVVDAAPPGLIVPTALGDAPSEAVKAVITSPDSAQDITPNNDVISGASNKGRVCMRITTTPKISRWDATTANVFASQSSQPKSRRLLSPNSGQNDRERTKTPDFQPRDNGKDVAQKTPTSSTSDRELRRVSPDNRTAKSPEHIEKRSHTSRDRSMSSVTTDVQVTNDVANDVDPAPKDTPPTPSIPQYEEIDSLIYLDEKVTKYGKKIKRATETVLICGCDEGDGKCSDSRCLNRQMMYECSSACGDKCQNRRLKLHQYSKVEPFYTGPLKGFGIRAVEPIKKGAFIIQYIGEVVNMDEYSIRSLRYSQELGHTHHYVFEMGPKIIDATSKGNCSRFINHSCEPNADCFKWAVPKTPRDVSHIGFFARRDIAAGEEITFDYQFFNYGREAQKCHCGTASCKGVIGRARSESPEDDEEEDTPDDDVEEEELESIEERNERDRERDRFAAEHLRTIIGKGCHGTKTAVRFVKYLGQLSQTDSRIRMLSAIEHSSCEFYQSLKRAAILEVVCSWLSTTDYNRHELDLIDGSLRMIYTKDNFVEKGTGWNSDLYETIDRISTMVVPDELIIKDMLDELVASLSTAEEKEDTPEDDVLTHSQLFERIIETAQRLSSDEDIKKRVAASNLRGDFKIPKKMKTPRAAAGKDLELNSSMRLDYQDKEIKNMPESPDRTRSPSRGSRWNDRRSPLRGDSRDRSARSRGHSQRHYQHHHRDGSPSRHGYKRKYNDRDVDDHRHSGGHRDHRYRGSRSPDRTKMHKQVKLELVTLSSKVVSTEQPLSDVKRRSTNAEQSPIVATIHSVPHMPDVTQPPPSSDIGSIPMHAIPSMHSAAIAVPGHLPINMSGAWSEHYGQYPYPYQYIAATQVAQPALSDTAHVPMPPPEPSFTPSRFLLTNDERYFAKLTPADLSALRCELAEAVRLVDNETNRRKQEREAEVKAAEEVLAEAQRKMEDARKKLSVLTEEVRPLPPPPPPVAEGTPHPIAKYAKAYHNGELYYFNKETRESAWELPEGEFADEEPCEQLYEPSVQADSSTQEYEDVKPSAENHVEQNICLETDAMDVGERAQQVLGDIVPVSHVHPVEEFYNDYASEAVRSHHNRSRSSVVTPIDNRHHAHSFDSEKRKMRKIKQFKADLEKDVTPIIDKYVVKLSILTDYDRRHYLVKQIAKEMFKRESERTDFEMKITNAVSKRVCKYASDFMDRKIAEGGRDLFKGYVGTV